MPANPTHGPLGWKRRYEDEYAIVARVWAALGVVGYDGGPEISERVVALRLAAEAAQATLDAIRAEVERSTPQPPGGQQVGPRPDLWSMSVSTRRALSRLLGNAALTVAPPSLVALHEKWCASSALVAALNEDGGGEDVEAFGEACDRYDADREALLDWTQKETP